MPALPSLSVSIASASRRSAASRHVGGGCLTVQCPWLSTIVHESPGSIPEEDASEPASASALPASCAQFSTQKALHSWYGFDRFGQRGTPRRARTRWRNAVICWASGSGSLVTRWMQLGGSSRRDRRGAAPLGDRERCRLAPMALLAAAYVASSDDSPLGRRAASVAESIMQQQ
jgi:hypothetical protein